MRRTFLIVFAASTLSAQFFDFAVTDDGRIYFATRLITGSEDARSKIYRVAGDGLTLFATGGGGGPASPSAVLPLTSGDGSVTGYALNYPCLSPSCGLSGLPRNFYQLQGVELSSAAFNNLQISRNGRFLLGSSSDLRLRLIELPGQQATEFPQLFTGAGSQSVANSGAVLLRDAGQTSFLRYVPLGEERRPIPGTENAVAGILSPDGDSIAYERNAGNRYDLVLTGPQGSTHRLLASVPRDLEAPWPAFRFRYQPSFANDGTLLYLEPGSDGAIQPVIVAAGGEPRRLIEVEHGVQTAILSGNGQVAWLATYRGRLLRVRTGDGAADEVIPETPYLAPGPVFPVSASVFALPGSVVRVAGTGITARTRFLLGDAAIPLSELSSQGTAVQIPWEYDAATGSRVLTVQGPGSPFLQRIDFASLDRPTITFERSSFGGVLQAAHQDFRGVVSERDPARLGETIHVFTRNMGPVDQPVSTGQPSPASPPARVTTPFACYLVEFDPPGSGVPRGRAVGLVVPFAGLSSGSIGIYQIDVTIPEDWRSPTAALQCRMESGGNMVHQDTARIDVAVGSAAALPAP